MSDSTAPRPRERGKVKRVLRGAAITIGLTLLLFVVLEGASSALLLVWRLGTAVDQRSGMDWRHTRHDEDLGWAHQPNSDIEGLYGPGLNFSTNSQGFRNDRDFEVEEPPGKLRVICSGDSFTLGYGVGDGDSWCAQLGSIDPRLETVNMGQVAYGVGQAYLWYMRDGRPLDHRIHILGVISVDFQRMMRDDFLGVAKPRLAVEDDALVVKNVPVRRPSNRLSRAEALEQVNDLRFVQAGRAALRRLPARGAPGGRSAVESASTPDRISSELVSTILDSLVGVNDAKGSTFVLAYIPVRSDLAVSGMRESSARWLQFLEEEATSRGFLLVNLIDEFARRSPGEIASMYIPKDGGVGRAHLSSYGNRIAAEEIYRRLQTVPELSGLLAPN